MSHSPTSNGTTEPSLCPPETGKELIEKLQNSSTIFTVEFHNGPVNKYVYDDHILSVNINCEMVLDNNKGTMSAAICLAHEMGHAALHLDGKVTPSALKISSFYKSLNEWLVLKKYENRIGRELGEPIRKKYADGLYKTRMNNSTHYKKDPYYKGSFLFFVDYNAE